MVHLKSTRGETYTRQSLYIPSQIGAYAALRDAMGAILELSECFAKFTAARRRPRARALFRYGPCATICQRACASSEAADLAVHKSATLQRLLKVLIHEGRKGVFSYGNIRTGGYVSSDEGTT